MFYTQLEAAKKGFVTEAMKVVANKEYVSRNEKEKTIIRLQ